MLRDTTESVAYNTKAGKLVIKDNKKFLALLSGAEDAESYEKILTYAKKIISSQGSDIPYGEHKSIASWAILKATQSFDDTAGANFLTYLTSKIRGEISDYRNKKNSMIRKVHKLINHEHESQDKEHFAYEYNKETEKNDLIKITEETPESQMHEEDVYYRKMQAFRMAFSGIPAYSQYILNRLVDSNLRLKALAEEEGVDVQEIARIRNYSLSIILNRVLRSNHLTDDEKDEVKKEHNIE